MKHTIEIGIPDYNCSGCQFYWDNSFTLSNHEHGTCQLLHYSIQDLVKNNKCPSITKVVNAKEDK
jgi:hypothetical protein